MSLFPAYGKNSNDSSNSTNIVEPTLKFCFEFKSVGNDAGCCAPATRVSNGEESEEVARGDLSTTSEETLATEPAVALKISHHINKKKKKKKCKKKSKKRSKNRKSSDSSDCELVPNRAETKNIAKAIYVISSKREPAYRFVKTLAWPAIPKYKIDRYLTKEKTSAKKKRQKVKRYFTVKSKKTAPSNADDEPELELSVELQLAEYNRRLSASPNDVQLWLEFVRCQDRVWQRGRRGGESASLELAERKLSLLDGALRANATDERLMIERVRIAQCAFPADEFCAMMKTLVDSSDRTNIVYWQGYIDSKQGSMAFCNATVVFELYSKCLSELHQSRRKSSADTSSERCRLEEKILTILYHCGLFLRQAGLYEKLWKIIMVYIQLNMADRNTKIVRFEEKTRESLNSSENELLELEETILKSKLPSHELWLRVEKLREHYQYWPLDERVDSGATDPQRYVQIETITDSIHPITNRQNLFKMAIVCLALAKIPLLPNRHRLVIDFGLVNCPWSLDALEPLLGLLLPHFEHGAMRTDSSRFVFAEYLQFNNGPQFLRTHPGQEECLHFLCDFLRNCAEVFPPNSKECAVLDVWWLRFERMLVVLERFDCCKILYKDSKKKRKQHLKESLPKFFQEIKSRSNALNYAELALLKYEIGDLAAAEKICKTNIEYHTKEAATGGAQSANQADFCYLTRCYVEILVSEGRRDEAINRLVDLAHDNTNLTMQHRTSQIENETWTKFDERLQELLQQPQPDGLTSQFLPDLLTEWILCNCWFLYLTKASVMDAGALLESLIVRENDSRLTAWQKEIVYEFYLFLLFKYCGENRATGLLPLLKSKLLDAIETFPNNLYLLGLQVKFEDKQFAFGESAWKIDNILQKSQYSIAAVVLVILSKRRYRKMLAIHNDTAVSNDSAKNRMLALFTKLTCNESSVKKCSLIWRWYLHFLYETGTEKELKNVYYAAVDECPWVKALYVDAAVYIPNELVQFQDLIVEKELRLHLTPEELEALKE